MAIGSTIVCFNLILKIQNLNKIFKSQFFNLRKQEQLYPLARLIHDAPFKQRLFKQLLLSFKIELGQVKKIFINY